MADKIINNTEDKVLVIIPAFDEEENIADAEHQARDGDR